MKLLLVALALAGCGSGPAAPPSVRPPPAATSRPSAPPPDPYAGARRSIAHSFSHTCAIQPGGELWCWGSNSLGQLGSPSPARAFSAQRVEGLPSVVSVAVDGISTCAVGADGSLWCFGYVFSSSSSGGPLRTPTRVPGFEGVVAVALGGAHRCALFASGKVACFGDDRGGLGVRHDKTPERAAIVEGLPPVQNLAASNDGTCALDRDGQAWCFGLGCGASPKETEAPYAVPEMTGLTRLSLADDALCGLGAGGQVRCVRCGDERRNPFRFEWPATPGATSLSADAQRGCVVIDGRVGCWGALARGPRGNANVRLGDAPRLEEGLGLAHVVDLSLDERSACALGDTGVVRCWGDNSDGRLGAGAQPWITVPGGAKTDLPFSGISTMAAAGDVTCVASGGADARCFGAPAALDVVAASNRVRGATLLWSTGWDLCGNAGQGEPSCFATHPGSTGPDVQGATWQTNGYASGPEGKCVVIDGRPRCVPRDGESEMLASLSRLSGVVSIAMGNEHACVVTEGGSVLCAGDNAHGQLGRPGKGSPRPSPVAGLSGIALVVSGETQTCALSKKAEVFCWGIDEDVGEKKGTDGRRPRLMRTQVRELVAGARHFCVADDRWDAWCWGSDAMGQLGNDEARAYAFEPVRVARGEDSVISVVAGAAHTCALFPNGTARCWGSNGDGQIGEATPVGFARRPFAVHGLPTTPAPTRKDTPARPSGEPGAIEIEE